ncbi:chromosome transmission fidelity protein 18 [Venturia nashicola]|nr:chromosome transmission fidelity protein 18 [Venturia nashicola]
MTSPTLGDSPRKRRKLDEQGTPLKSMNGNARVGGFMEDDSDDDQPGLPSTLFHKRRTPELEREDTVLNLPGFEVTIQKESERPSLDKPTEPETLSDSAYASDNQDGFRHVDDLDPVISNAPQKGAPTLLKVTTTSGRAVYVQERRKAAEISYEQLIAARSIVVEGQARRNYYGIDIHQLMDDATREAELDAQRTKIAPPSPVRQSVEAQPGKKSRTLMWSEKYRARKFTDLVGDERTHRSVLRWLKHWDPIVFPGSGKPKLKAGKAEAETEERPHRKILLLTGPPGLGKTTLAHVCAKQAGYEVQEINASDERSSQVVKGRIRDMVGTENVKGSDVRTADGKVRKAGKPVCVIVDEVDGVVGGGSAGEGGFVKALIDLVTLDAKNSNAISAQSTTMGPKKKKKGDKFRLLRPLVLICNDVYHPALRPLRQSNMAEIIHIRKPPLNMVVSRVHSIFEKEGVPSDIDGIRRLCEVTWGVGSRKEGGLADGTGAGDIRSVMVVGEWVASKLRASAGPQKAECPRLTRRWLEDNVLNDLSHGGGGARSLGRGGAREVTDRVFQEGAGFPKTDILATKLASATGLESIGVIGVAEGNKRRAMERLREMIDMSGETDRIVTDCFATYPTEPIQDDTFLSKPNAAYDWLNFHDVLSSQVHLSQEWELAPYLSSPVLAFHHLFASTNSARKSFAAASNNNYSRFNNDKDAEAEAPAPFSGPAANYTASEMLKANSATITLLQNSLSLPLMRMYRSPASIACELLPYTLRMLSPEVKPVIIHSSALGSAKSAPTASVRKASEKALVARAVQCMAATGVRFEKSRVEVETRAVPGGWVFRMEPPLDSLGTMDTLKNGEATLSVRYAVRQVLEMEWKKENIRREEELRRARMGGDTALFDLKPLTGKDKEVGRLDARVLGAKKDFFGRTVQSLSRDQGDGVFIEEAKVVCGKAEERRVWVRYQEGFSNAVRKPISLREVMDGL